MQLKCPTCGAILSVRDGTQAFVCPSCKGGVIIDDAGVARGASIQEVQTVRSARKAGPGTSEVETRTPDEPAPPELHAWQVLMAAGWSAVIFCFAFCLLAALHSTGALSITYWVAALGALLSGIANHTFCRLCQHVQEIRDHLRSEAPSPDRSRAQATDPTAPSRS